jgi:hypothetical protein
MRGRTRPTASFFAGQRALAQQDLAAQIQRRQPCRTHFDRQRSTDQIELCGRGAEKRLSAAEATPCNAANLLAAVARLACSV